MATAYGSLAIVLWGLLALLGKLTQAIPPFQLLAICFSISALIVFIKRPLQGKPCYFKPSLTPLQWLIGVAGLFGFHFCYFMALRHGPVLEVSLIVYLWPLLLALAVAQPNRRLKALLGGGLGFIGVFGLIANGQSVVLEGQFILGYSLAGLCALIWAGYSWFSSVSGCQSKEQVDDIAWLSLVVAGFSLVAHWQLETTVWQLSALEWIGVLLLGLGPVGGAFYLWDIGLKKGNPSLLASLSYAAPVISSLALLFAGMTKGSLMILVALLFILVGGLIANKNDRRSIG